jgi:predicted CxxxxCH...CXXCH cytochrome family protein
MRRKSWTLSFALAAASGLALSCGSEGSIGNSGSNDWSFDGSMLPGSAGKAAGTTGSSNGNSGGSSSTPGGGTTGNGGPAAGSPSAGSGSGNMAGKGSGGGSGPTPGTGYHQLANWTEPQANNPNHHGRIYFLGNAHKDENGAECTSCHGQSYEGGSGPACSSCHEEWRSSCTFCHGTAGMFDSAPPRGVWDETSTASLAVGRHVAHLTAGSSHQAFACTSCHQVPAADDVTHTLGYQASTDLSTPGHHGDVNLAASLPGMTWNVGATSGTPVSARGSCVGGCHSDGRGGAPLKTPYWGGGSWTTGCGNCHAARPNSGHHDHALDEGGTCANCHSGSTTNQYSAATHLNGKREYLGTIQGQGMTLTADPSCASGVRCNGSCHGNDEGHNNRCW